MTTLKLNSLPPAGDLTISATLSKDVDHTLLISHYMSNLALLLFKYNVSRLVIINNNHIGLAVQLRKGLTSDRVKQNDFEFTVVVPLLIVYDFDAHEAMVFTLVEG